MRGALAFIGWLAASFVFAVVATNLLDSKVSMDTERLLVFAGLVVIAIGAVRFGLGGAAAAETATELSPQQLREIEIDNIRAAVSSRFGGKVFILSPDDIKAHVRKDSRAHFSDEQWDRWGEILDLFPAEPRTQREAVMNETRFWQRWVKKFAVRDALGNLDLYKTADIQNHYEKNERWILREYFAATGKTIDPFLKEEIRLSSEKKKAEKHTSETIFDFDQYSPPNTKRRSEIERFERELDQYQREGRKAHFEKWGKWFSAHVEDAFIRITKQTQETPIDVHGEGGFATARDIKGLKGAAKGPWGIPAQGQGYDT